MGAPPYILIVAEAVRMERTGTMVPQTISATEVPMTWTPCFRANRVKSAWLSSPDVILPTLDEIPYIQAHGFGIILNASGAWIRGPTPPLEVAQIQRDTNVTKLKAVPTAAGFLALCGGTN
jgi:hypothetical protein